MLNPSPWQSVIHGPQNNSFRILAVDVLIEARREKNALRYALCGTGDSVLSAGDRTRLRPRGCNMRLCPRCSRKRNSEKARRILGWLAYEPHGALDVHCLTQRCIEGESFGDCKLRLTRRVAKYMKALKPKILSGALIYHIVFSTAKNAWHLHAHCVLEWKIDHGPEASKDLLIATWVHTSEGSLTQTDPNQHRRVLVGGPALAGLRADRGDIDFWKEAEDDAAKAVQYPIRDLCQGLEAWRFGADDAERARAIHRVMEGTRSWRMIRLWGKWSKPCAAAAAAWREEKEKVALASASKSGVDPSVDALRGTVDVVLKNAANGDRASRQLLIHLANNANNGGPFAKRLVVLVAAVCRLTVLTLRNRSRGGTTAATLGEDSS